MRDRCRRRAERSLVRPEGRTRARERGVRRALAAAMLVLAVAPLARAEDGYELWLRYRPLPDARALAAARSSFTEVVVQGGSPTLEAARAELLRGLRGLLDREVPLAPAVSRDGAIVAGTPKSSPAIAALDLGGALARAGDEGFVIRSTRIGGRRATVVAANSDVGVLYGVFRLLRHLQTGGGRRRHRRRRGPARAAARARPLGQPGRHASSAATPASRCGTGTSCPTTSTRATRTTRAPTRRSASTAPCSTTSTPTPRA